MAGNLSSSSNFSSQNTTNAPSGKAPFEEPQASKIFRIVFFSLTTLASLLGNSIMLKAACEFPSRKPLSYHLVTNLAAAEIISTLCASFTFVYMHLDHWPFGEFACKVTIPLQVLSLFVVTSTLTAIAVYRFVFIVFQLRITVSYCRLVLFFSLLWLVALAVSMPLFVFYKVFPRKGGVLWCYVDGMPHYETYQIVLFILNYGLPCLIMVVSYGAVALKLKRHIRRNRREVAEMSELGETTKQPQEEEEQQDREATERERRKISRAITDLENDLLRMIYVVIIVFAVCYLPYQVNFLLFVFKFYDERYPEAEQYRSIINMYCLILSCLSSALHPLCYGTINKFYARTFSRLVLCRCKSE